MTAKSPATLSDGATAPDDDIPDMSVALWYDKFAAATMRRGRMKAVLRQAVGLGGAQSVEKRGVFEPK